MWDEESSFLQEDYRLEFHAPRIAFSAQASRPAQMFTSVQEQQQKSFTPGNSQTELGTKEAARLSRTDLSPFVMSMIPPTN
ncbi:hypothetical protein EYF80_015183 [Liparis tanakae]|uniref:Uncharacterized protein n=1 Tax=Liparis tanakae TaxID=230148 RepID=A0A4Z2I9D6_9TELE|nr:hypothetical protein EYF80_015183 [Liparis tanakae]